MGAAIGEFSTKQHCRSTPKTAVEAGVIENEAITRSP